MACISACLGIGDRGQDFEVYQSREVVPRRECLPEALLLVLSDSEEQIFGRPDVERVALVAHDVQTGTQLPV
jgi:hypothetical protein